MTTDTDKGDGGPDQREIDEAQKRVVNALWSDKTPDPDDVAISQLCPSCYGYGYYYREHNLHRKMKCKTCGGDGSAKSFRRDASGQVS